MGLFHTYGIPDLPRTNNAMESEFRDLNQHLLRTTGQKGGARRIIQRYGAWELIPRPGSLSETVEAIATVTHSDYQNERTRLHSHRDRFRFHIHSIKRSRKQLQDLKERWLLLPPIGSRLTFAVLRISRYLEIWDFYIETTLS